MTEYVKLLLLLLPVAALIIGGVIVLRRYNSNGDKCPHGVRGGEGFDCRRCDGRGYEVKVYSEAEVEPARLRRDC